MLAGYDYSHTTQELVSLSNPNNVFVNANGESGGRRHQFKVERVVHAARGRSSTGVEFRIQSGLPITRTWGVAAVLDDDHDQLRQPGPDGQR